MRILLASILSAVALFFLGFLWWGILMPVVRPASVIADQALVDAMGSSLDETGLYFYPDYAEPADEGPLAILFYNKEMPSMSTMMGMGFGHMFVSALFACIVVTLLPLRTFKERFTLVFCLGLFTAVWANGGNLIWWRHPPAWCAFHFGYDAVSWLLAGVIIASIVKTKVNDQ